MRFIDSLLPLKRVHEYVILDYILKNDSVTKELLLNELTKYLINPNFDDLSHSIKHLQGKLFNNSDKSRYKTPLSLNRDIELSDEFANCIRDKKFREYLSISLEYGLRRYQRDELICEVENGKRNRGKEKV